MSKQKLRAWGLGLIGAVINSAAGATTLIAIDPLGFNLDTGLLKLLKASAALAVVGFFLYLKQHPIPLVEE